MVYSFPFFPPAPAKSVRQSVLGDSCCCCALLPLGGTEGIEICCRTCANTHRVSQGVMISALKSFCLYSKVILLEEKQTSKSNGLASVEKQEFIKQSLTHFFSSYQWQLLLKIMAVLHHFLALLSLELKSY